MGMREDRTTMCQVSSGLVIQLSSQKKIAGCMKPGTEPVNIDLINDVRSFARKGAWQSSVAYS
jgi:hypothetical protein